MNFLSSRISGTMFGLFLTLSLTAGPAVETYRQCQEDPQANAGAWRTALNNLQRTINDRIFTPDKEFRKFDTDEKSLRQQLKKEQLQIMSDPGYRRLLLRAEKLQKEYQKVSRGGSSSPEADLKQKQLWDLAGQIAEYASNAPKLKAIQQKLDTASAGRERRSMELLNSSELSEAKEMLEILELARSSAPGPDGLSAFYRIESNPFARTFADLDPSKLSARFSEENAKLFYAKLKEENPKADDRGMKLYAEMYCGALAAFPDDLPPIPTEPCAEPQDEAFRLQRLSVAGKRDNADFLRASVMLLPRLPEGTFTRLWYTDLYAGFGKTSNVRKGRKGTVIRAAVDCIKSGSAQGPFARTLYNLLSHHGKNEDFKELDDLLTRENISADPWLRNMITGRASLDRGWEARGAGWANTVTQEGWKVFHAELEKARGCFNKALELHPDWGNPYIQLIRVEMGNGSAAGAIRAFNSLAKLHPDIPSAYENLTWALYPRWCGSHKLILQFAEAAMATECYESIIPSLGFCQIADAAKDYPDYRWKNLYRSGRVTELGDKLFEARLESAEKSSRTFLLAHRALFEMATLRYDKAAATVKEFGGVEDFRKFCAEKWWRGGSGGHWYPLIAIYDDEATFFELFTGPRGPELQTCEKLYLDGDDKGRARLAALIRSGNFQPKEKNFLIDLYGRWSIPAGGDDYFSCNDYANLFNSFQVAAQQDRFDVVSEMISLGFDYQAGERYPGETAILAVMTGTDPRLLDTLHKAGDPLNRPEPERKHTPMHRAAFSANAAMVAKLLALGLPPDGVNAQGHTPLQLAVSVRNGSEAAKLLMNAGADIAHPDSDGDTALMFTMQVNGPRELWTELIRRTKKIDQANNSGRTALHYAAEYAKDPETAKALLAAGADPAYKDKSGRTPLDVAREKNKESFVKLLEKKR